VPATFHHTVDAVRPFDEVVAAVQSETAARAFRVLAVHDVQATLAEKGFAREPMTIVEVCNARYASQVLDADPLVGLMLPCRIVVWTEGDAVKAGTMLPSMIATFYPDAGIEDVAAEVEAILIGIVDAAAL
jgi:uncharacterized protein (DUF302 family)